MNELMKKHKAAVAQVPHSLLPRFPHVRSLRIFLQNKMTVCFRFQSTRDLAQISDLQAQLEEAAKEKQELQDKVLQHG